MISSADQIFEHEVNQVFRTEELPEFVDWIDEHYVIKGQRWKSHGYQRSLAFVFSDLDTPEINQIKGTQIGSSEEGNAFALYEVTVRGRDVGVYLPRSDPDLKQYAGVVLTRAIRDIEVCKDALIVDPGARDAANTNARKEFKKASIYMRASDIPSSYDQIGFSTAMQDEASRMADRVKRDKDSVGESPFDAIKSRMDAATYRKHLCYSSPEEYGACAITDLYENSRVKVEQHIPCPHCEHYQPLEWGDAKKSHGMQWDRICDNAGQRDNFKCASTAWYKCRACHQRIDYEDMIQLDDMYGHYRSEDQYSESGEITIPAIRLSVEDKCWYEIDSGKVAEKPYSLGIRQTSMFSRTKTWFDAVKQYLDAVDELKAGDNSKMMSFDKRYLAKAYRDEKATDFVKWEFVKKRVESYCQDHDDDHTYGVPNNVQAIFGWWDLQNDWIQGGYIGYAFGEESWWLRNMIRIGDPATTDSMKIIDAMMNHKFIRDDETVLKPLITGIDSGDRPNLAYKKSLALGRTVVIPTKGSSVYGKAEIDFPQSPKENCMKTFMTMVGTITMKDLIYGRLTKVEELGPGFVHIPDSAEFDDEFFKGLCSEAKGTKGGKIEYKKLRDRNEPLDIAVGCQAMLSIAKLDKFGLKLIQNSENIPTSNTVSGSTDTTAAIAKGWPGK